MTLKIIFVHALYSFIYQYLHFNMYIWGIIPYHHLSVYRGDRACQIFHQVLLLLSCISMGLCNTFHLTTSAFKSMTLYCLRHWLLDSLGRACAVVLKEVEDGGLVCCHLHTSCSRLQSG